ncbi:leucine-rich repeat-containing protein 4-like [Lytechinus variegatus]|uniref:leucine-rich repeat-containing protein 4-like n=1 Tax=Lytechinus variegatus TaxID=7654 RepID=UPI001BB1FB7C|nr:leucine-rich repeat-containing protein 4-like [Lytechinus variegatus]
MMKGLGLVLMINLMKVCLNNGFQSNHGNTPHAQTCVSDCETNIQNARLSCEGQMLQCVPDPCCQTETRHLNMANNHLTHIKILAFQSFPRLRILDLRQNALANIAPGAFSNLNQLQLLDVRANKLRHLYGGMFNGLSSIQKLYLANNEIESIAPGTFAGMTHLISLKLNYNKVTTLYANMFFPLQRLQRLYIYGNRISAVNEEAFRGLVNLVTLSLAENPFVTLPNILPYIPQITHIRLEHVRLTCDCRLEFLRMWLRDNLYEAYESYALCHGPEHVQGTPMYHIQEPLPCPTRDRNLPISREDNDPSHVADPDEAASHTSAQLEIHSESASEYSEFFASFSELSHGSVSKTSVTSTEGGISESVHGSGTVRADSGASSTVSKTHIPIEPLTPRGTLSPVVTTESHIVASEARSEDGFTHFTPPTMTESSHKNTSRGNVPDSPIVNETDSSSRVNGSFNELPRPTHRAGSRNHPDRNNGHQHGHRDDSVTTTVSYETTDPYRSTPTPAEIPRGPPQSWGLKGSSVTIRCPVHIHNMNDSKIKWLTPHGKLIMSNVSRYGITKRGSLIINNLQAYDHGTYRCIVRKALNSVKMLPARLTLVCPCQEEAPKKPSFEPSVNSSKENHFGQDADPHHEHSHPPYDTRCSPVPMVVAIVTTFQATVALCVITFCLCCSKNLNYSLKDRTCTGVPEPIAVVRTRGKFNTRSRDFVQSGEPTSSSVLSSGGSDFYEALTDHGFSPRQASSVRSYDAYYESHPGSEYVNYRKPKNYMYMVGYMDTGSGRRAVGYRSSTESQCASIKEITNENIYVSKD